VGVGGGEGGVVKALAHQPPLVRVGPSAATVAQQEPAQAKPGPGPVGQHVGPGPAQVPDGLLGHGRQSDRDQLAGPVQPGQPPAVAPVGLGPCRRVPWGSASARSPDSAPPTGPTGGPAHSQWGRPHSRLAAGSDPGTAPRARAPTARRWRSGPRSAPPVEGRAPPPRSCPGAHPNQGRSDHSEQLRHWAPAGSFCVWLRPRQRG
jgi:hypothetical protein